MKMSDSNNKITIKFERGDKGVYVGIMNKAINQAWNLINALDMIDKNKEQK